MRVIHPLRDAGTLPSAVPWRVKRRRRWKRRGLRSQTIFVGGGVEAQVSAELTSVTAAVFGSRIFSAGRDPALPSWRPMAPLMTARP